MGLYVRYGESGIKSTVGTDSDGSVGGDGEELDATTDGVIVNMLGGVIVPDSVDEEEEEEEEGEGEEENAESDIAIESPTAVASIPRELGRTLSLPSSGVMLH
jgi:hypothetical protein